MRIPDPERPSLVEFQAYHPQYDLIFEEEGFWYVDVFVFFSHEKDAKKSLQARTRIIILGRQVLKFQRLWQEIGGV